MALIAHRLCDLSQSSGSEFEYMALLGITSFMGVGPI